MIVLGISLGTMKTGVCVITDEGLAERYLHRFQFPWADYKLRAIINRYKYYIVKYNVTDIVVKIAPIESNTKALLKLMRHIEILAKKHNCKFDLITKKEIKEKLQLQSTSEIISYIKLVYPELNKETVMEKYQQKMYEAIVAGYIYYKRYAI